MASLWETGSRPIAAGAATASSSASASCLTSSVGVVHTAKAAIVAAAVLAIGATLVACSGDACDAIDVPGASEGAGAAGAVATSNTLTALCCRGGSATLLGLSYLVIGILRH